MVDRCQNEIVELHQFFEDWFNKRIPDTQKQFSRVGRVLSDSFRIITPRGTIVEKVPLLDGIRSAFGNYLMDDQPDAIWIKQIGGRQISDDHCLVMYEEWQGDQKRKSGNGRLSSALFKKAVNTPNGVIWIHLHETWLS